MRNGSKQASLVCYTDANMEYVSDIINYLEMGKKVSSGGESFSSIL